MTIAGTKSRNPAASIRGLRIQPAGILAGERRDNGVALTKKVETSLGVRKFASRESGNRPQLVINFQP